MAYDDVLILLGEFGPYHRWVFLLLTLINVYTAFPLLKIVFLFLDVPFRCSVPGLDNDTFHIQDETHHLLVNTSIPYDVTTGLYSQCLSYSRESIEDDDNFTVPCARWVFDPDYASSSLVSTMNLVCDRQQIKAQFVMMLTVGLLVSGVGAGPLADTIGRKTTTIALILINSVALVVQASITNLTVHLFLGSVIAACMQGTFVTSLTLMIEIVGPNKRPLAELGCMIGYSIGLLLATPFFYLVSDWQIASFTMAGLGCCYILYFWAIQESPRWLLTRGKMEDAKKILRHMAEVNKVNLPEDLQLTAMMESGDEKETGRRKCPLKYLKPMFTNRVLCLRMAIFAFGWFTVHMIYSGTTYSIGILIEGNVYLNFLTQAVMENLGYILAFILMKHFKRRPLFCAFYLVSGISYLVTALSILLDKGTNWIPVVSYAFGKFGVTGTYSLVYIVANELMPTVTRNSALGLCQIIGALGGVIAPHLATVNTIIPNNFGKALPVFIFSIIATISAFLVLLLPETKNQKLPDTIEDAKNLSRNHQRKQLEPTTTCKVPSVSELSESARNSETLL